MVAHANPDCTHGGATLRLWLEGDHAGALRAARHALAAGDFSRPDEERWLKIQEAVLGARLGELPLEYTLALLTEARSFFAPQAPYQAMETTVIGIELAAQLGEYETAADWMGEFLLRHGDVPQAIAYIWLLMARWATVCAGHQAGLPYFEQALKALPEESAACTHEIFARNAAAALLPAGQRDRVRSILCQIGVDIREDDGGGSGYTLEELVIKPGI